MEPTHADAVAMRPSGSFVLRTPALPFDEFERWCEGARVGDWTSHGDEPRLRESWRASVDTLRSRLRDIVSRPEVLQALFVASPSLESSLAHWRQAPDSRKGLKTERALVRYFARMCGRPMPFGIFSACSHGVVDQAGATTELLLEGRDAYRTTSRLDFDYLFAVTDGLRRDPAIAHDLTYSANPTLRRLGDAWHVIESRVSTGSRSHHLVKMYSDEFLEAVIDRARSGARIHDLVDLIRGLPDGAEITTDEAAAYIQELISADVLVSTLTPLVTGAPPLDEIITQLETLAEGGSAANTLSSVRSGLAALDRHGLGVAPGEYLRLADSLAPLPADVDIARLYQVDLTKPAKNAVLAKPVIDSLVSSAALLCRIGQIREPQDLRTFREEFLARYEHAWIPLVEALDEDTGIPFGSAGADSSSLLRGLQLGNGGGGWSEGEPLSPFHALLLNKLTACARERREELVLEESDIPATGGMSVVLPDAFNMSALLVASSQEAVNAGDFKLFVKGGAGPSGARLIGRFCHVDPAFEDATRKHLAEEEALQPDAVFAEIVYLPEGRVGNVLCRPVLREYEITCMGRSGAAADRQIPLSDLLISVATDGAILLYSRRLGRQVLPRLTNAHGFLNPKLSAVYRFLTYLQNQGGGGIPPFRWGPLDVFDDLPRVRCGRHILAAARWKISREDVQQLDTPDRYDAFAALQRLRARRGLPRWVVLIEVDNALPADLDNPLSVDALVHVMKRAQQCVLAEMCPGPDDLCVTGPEGRFCHELLIPFVKERPRAHTDTSPAVTPVERAIAAAKTPVPASVRSFPPGSEWLYLKVYGGGSALDDALTTSVSSLLTQIAPARRLSKWFFLRYGDPHQHLRIRFQGSPHWLVAELLPLIHRTLAPLCQRGTIWKVEIGTYEREVERYGGPDSMLFAEDIFCADSDAVVEILRTLEGDEGAEARWRIALLGVHRLFDDCGVAADVRRDVMARARDSFLHEFRVGSQGKSQLSDRFRNQRHAIDALMHADGRGDDAMAIARAVFDRRSTRIAQAVTQLESLARRGTLHVPISELAISFSHMHVNRMIRASGRAHELILYDFLLKWYDARLARERQTHSATATVAHEAVATPRALVSPLE